MARADESTVMDGSAKNIDQRILPAVRQVSVATTSGDDMTASGKEDDKTQTSGSQEGTTWGPKLFWTILVLMLVFFWWLLIYSGGVEIQHG